MPKVSIVMPVYNVEKFIRDSIDSVLAQTYQNYELILIDDGSPDNSPVICDEYKEKDNRIAVIHKKNGGLSSARNAGVNLAKGKYILFVDSDDTIDKNLLSDVVPVAEESNADVTIFGIHTFVLKAGKITSEKNGSHKPFLIEGKEAAQRSFVYLTRNSMWNHPYDKLYRKSIIKDNNVQANSYYDRVCEDTVFLLDLFPFVKKICVMGGCYYNYFIRDNQSVVAKFIPERYEKYYGRFCKTEKLMESFLPEYQDIKLLYQLYCEFIIWAYEFMFHKDCDYGAVKRYFYMKKVFSIRKENIEFCKKAASFIQKQDIYENASGSTKRVLISILHNHYFVAWFFHMAALSRR